MNPEQNFRGVASGEFPPELDQDPAVIYGLDRNFRIVYCNRAWDEFARANGGGAVLREKVIGKLLFDFVRDPLGDFYRSALKRARVDGQSWEHTYECSSPGLMRQYQMKILPLMTTPNLLVVNSLVVERPHDRDPHDPTEASYRDAQGILAMCSHCRRTRRVTAPEIWDWVPAYVLSTPQRVSHGLCAVCVAYHYPGFGPAKR